MGTLGDQWRRWVRINRGPKTNDVNFGQQKPKSKQQNKARPAKGCNLNMTPMCREIFDILSSWQVTL